MENDFTLKFTLKQHTPIIHFQAKQKGATLRASELKPKLDKFLIERLGGKAEVKRRGWLIGDGEHLALDYRVRIKNCEEYEKYYIFSYLPYKKKKVLDENSIKYIEQSLYFAQEEEYNEKGNSLFRKTVDGFVLNEEKLSKIERFGLKCKDNKDNKCIGLTIISFNNDLREFIDNNIEDFFTINNFGTRQNKGFGSFSLESTTIDSYENSLVNNFNVVYKYKSNKSLNEIFKIIKNDYTHLKAGLNDGRGNYKKSLLFLYFVSQNIRWEKRKFKVEINQWIRKQTNKVFLKTSINSSQGRNSAIYDEEGNQNWFDRGKYNYQYIRATLGLSDRFEFATNKNDKKYIVKLENSSIKRYKSPITFKVFNKNIYLCATNEDAILNKSFNLDTYLNKDSIDVDLRKIDTPQQFDIVDFLDFAFNRSNENIGNWNRLNEGAS